MINLELVEHDLTPCGEGKPITRTVVAMATSHTALREYCKDQFDTEVVHENANEFDKYYTIHQFKVRIVQFDFKSDKIFVK